MFFEKFSVQNSSYVIEFSRMAQEDAKTRRRLVQKYISEGAEYILFTEKKFVDDKFTGIKIGEKDGVVIYMIKTDS